MPQRSVRIVTVTMLLTLVASAAHAQVRTTGQIVGTIRDPTGAVVPDAEIEIRDLATNITQTTKSARDGAYVFAAVQPGRYTLTAIAKGFQPIVIENISVETARPTTVPIQAEVAGVTEAVTVEGRSQVIETTSTTISTTVGNAQIEKLPMGGRSVLVFALLIPGASTSSP